MVRPFGTQPKTRPSKFGNHPQEMAWHATTLQGHEPCQKRLKEGAGQEIAFVAQLSLPSVSSTSFLVSRWPSATAASSFITLSCFSGAIFTIGPAGLRGLPGCLLPAQWMQQESWTETKLGIGASQLPSQMVRILSPSSMAAMEPEQRSSGEHPQRDAAWSRVV